MHLPAAAAHILTYERAGWIGNCFFFGRWIVQWLAAERSGSNRSPELFWLASLVGTALLGAYAAHRGEAVLVAGFVTNGAIYFRNLMIIRRRATLRPFSMRPAAAVAVLAGLILVAVAIREEANVASEGWWWLACVALGQGMWSGRFVLQWWYSERAGESYFPMAFWSLSLAGNLLLLSYAIHLGDAVIIAGLAPGPLLQLRNLMLARAGAAKSSARAPTSLALR